MDASVRLGGVNLRAYLLREVSFSEILGAKDWHGPEIGQKKAVEVVFAL